MKKNSALIVSGFLFLLVAIAHLLRFILHIEITVSGHMIPMQVSLFGFVITFALSIWMFAASKAKNN